MIVIDAAIALTALGHKVPIETGIRHGVLGHRVAIVVHTNTTTVLRLAVLEAPQEEASASKSTGSHYTHDDARRNGSSVGTRALLL